MVTNMPGLKSKKRAAKSGNSNSARKCIEGEIEQNRKFYHVLQRWGTNAEYRGEKLNTYRRGMKLLKSTSQF